MRGRAFTLVELLVVVGILSILFAMLAPVIASVRGLAFENRATQGLRQIGMATLSYVAEHDECFPLATYAEGSELQAWYGRQSAQGVVDTSKALLAPYTGGKLPSDPTHEAQNYLGDGSGYGYNYGFLGSDFGVRGDLWGWPNAQNPARLSEIENPSGTVAYATSAFYNAAWLPNGDGNTYDFGFIDAPTYWRGIPNVDFRHQGKRVIDPGRGSAYRDGKAPAAIVDGRATALTREKTTDRMFVRSWRAEN